MGVNDRYWDSDVFLGWLLGEQDKEDECRSVIREAEAGRLRLITSALTLTEVIKLKARTPLLPEKQPVIDAYFKQEYIVIRQLDRPTAELARRMIWEHGFQPKDSVHVATALRAKVRFLDTFDKGLIRKSGKIGNPPLTIARPYLPGQGELALEARPYMESDEPQEVIDQETPEL